MPLFRKGDEPVFGYRLEKFLGRGQFGDVWMAIAPGKLRVALKFIDLGGKQGLKEFKGVQRVREIRHPHLMSITALWLLDEEGQVLSDDVIDQLEAQAAGRPVDLKKTMDIRVSEPALMVVAMPLGEKSLMDLLEDEGPAAFSTEELINYMEESAKGIDYLNAPKHDLGDGIRVGIQHCDIKPANIMLMGDSALVCDFGLARVLAYGGDVRATTTGMAGTPAYMAPECIEGKLPSDSTDQYSLAITYYELRTGKLPFEEESQTSQMAILTAHVKGNLDFSRLAPEEQEVIRKATSVDPAARWPSCSIMVRELRNAIATSGVYKPDVRESDWTRSQVGGAPSGGSSLFETNVEVGKKNKRGSQVGSYHETMDPGEAAAAEKAISESDLIERPPVAEGVAPERPTHSKTLMTEALDEPPPQESKGQRDTLIEEPEKDTRRDSVRYEKPPYDRRQKIPWGAITTVVGLLAVGVVITLNFGQDWPVVGQYLRPSKIDPVDPGKGNPDSGNPETGNPNTGNPETGNPESGTGGPPPPAPAPPPPSPAPPPSPPPPPPVVIPPPPPDPDPWQVELTKRLQENQFLAACQLFTAAGELAIPADKQLIAAGEIQSAWLRAVGDDPTASAEMGLIADAAVAIPAQADQLKAKVVKLFRDRTNESVRAIQQQFRDQESTTAKEAADRETELGQLIALINNVGDDSLKNLLADAYLLSARAKLRQAKPTELDDKVLAAVRVDLSSMEGVVPPEDNRAHYTVEQQSILKLLELVPVFDTKEPLKGMNQIDGLLSDPRVTGTLPPWETQIANGLKARLGPAIIAMAKTGELSNEQRAIAVKYWNIPGEDIFGKLTKHLAQAPKNEVEIKAYYAKLTELANSFLASDDADRGSEEWAIAKCCAVEGRLASRPELPDNDWFQIEDELKTAEDNLKNAENGGHRTYLQYVKSVVAYLSPVSTTKDSAADWIDNAYNDPPPLLVTSFRREMAAEIVSSTLENILPDDNLFREDTVEIDAADLSKARAALTATKVKLKSKLGPQGLMYDVIVTGFDLKPSLDDVKAAGASVKGFDSSEGTADLLKKTNQAGLYSLAKARIFDQLAKADGIANPPAHAAAAIVAFAEIGDQLWTEQQRQIRGGQRSPIRYETIYSLTVAPAISLDAEANLTDSKSKAALARAYFLKGKLIEHDPDFADQFRTEEKPTEHHLVAMNSFARAGELDPQLDYFTEQGFQLLEAKTGSEAAKDMPPILEKVVKFDSAKFDPQALRLQAKGIQLDALKIHNPDVLREKVEQVFTMFSLAQSKMNPADPHYPDLLVDLAGTLVARAFAVKDAEADKRREYLDKAIELAGKATENPYRTHPAAAYAAMGNANEDIAHYIYKDDPQTAETFYKKANANFIDALKADPNNRWRSQGKTYMSLGRLALRHAKGGDMKNEGTRRELLEKAIDDHLQKAITFNKNDQYYYSQSHYWAGEVAYTMADPRVIGQLEEEERTKLVETAERHFNEAVDSAKAAKDDSWAEFELPWAQNMYVQAKYVAYVNYRRGQIPIGKFLDLEKVTRGKILKHFADQGAEKLKPDRVFTGTMIMLDLSTLTPGGRNGFLQAADIGIGLLQANAGKSKSYEAALRMERATYIAEGAAIEVARDRAPIWGNAEEAIVKNDLDFIEQNKDNIDAYASYAKKVNLLRRFPAAITTHQGDNKQALLAATNDLMSAIKVMGKEVVVSRRARELHLRMVIRLLESKGLTDEQKNQVVDDVTQSIETLKEGINDPDIRRTYDQALGYVKNLK